VTGARRVGTWEVERSSGPAGPFHARDLPDEPVPAVWVHEVTRPALVLGSTQGDEVVDTGAAAAAGVDVVRRRSGGGAVLLVPGRQLWVDVVVPRDHERWSDDVGLAFHWLGEAWADALGSLGVAAEVHRGALVRTAWSRLVCFAGLGPGEVTVGGRKVVGVSQRRTRAAARFQCSALAAWEPGPLLHLLRLDPAERRRAGAELADAAAGVGVDLAALEAAFLARLG